MQILFHIPSEFERVPIGGIAAIERMQRAFSSIVEKTSIQTVQMGAEVPNIRFEKGLMWVEGLFPFLSEQVPTLLQQTGKTHPLVYTTSPGKPNWGLFYTQSAGEVDSLKTLIEGLKDQAVEPATDPLHLQSLCSARDFAILNECAYQLKRDRLIEEGVFFVNPETAWIDEDVTIAPGVIIHPNVKLAGETRIDPGCEIHMGACLKNVQVASNVTVKPYSVLEDCKIGVAAAIGPFSHIRPGTEIGSDARVGNFVEMKNTSLGSRSKAGHLTYLGDASIGEDCNIGAGTITCNYDGFNKNRTVLENGVFIGSGAELVAPLHIGSGGYVAAGSTITHDVPDQALAIARQRQVTKPGRAEAVRDLAEKKKRPLPHTSDR